jgi:hypothetical protein
MLHTNRYNFHREFPLIRLLRLMKNRWRKRSPIDLQLLNTTSSLSSYTKSSFMAVWPIRRSRIRPASRLTPSKASRRFTCLIGVPEVHQSSRDGGTKSTSLSFRVYLLRPAMSDSAAEMSGATGASKKVFRAHPRKPGASKKVRAHPRKFFERIQESLAHPRKFERIQESFSSASKKVWRIQESSSASKKVIQAQPRKFSGASKSFIIPVWYILLVKVKPHKQLRRYLCLFKA